EVGDGAAADVSNRQPDDEREDEGADDQALSVLTLRREAGVQMQRVVVHREKRKEVVVALGDGLSGPVAIDVSLQELIEISPEGKRSRGSLRVHRSVHHRPVHPESEIVLKDCTATTVRKIRRREPRFPAERAPAARTTSRRGSECPPPRGESTGGRRESR